jgi:hypothetical protein
MNREHYRMPHASSVGDNMTARRSRHRANANYSMLIRLFVEQNPLLMRGGPLKSNGPDAVGSPWREVADEI